MVKVKIIETGKTDILKFVVDGCDILPDLMEGCGFQQGWDEELAEVLLVPQNEYEWWVEMVDLLYEEQSLKEELEEEYGIGVVNEALSQVYESDLKNRTLHSIEVLKDYLETDDD